MNNQSTSVPKTTSFCALARNGNPRELLLVFLVVLCLVTAGLIALTGSVEIARMNGMFSEGAGDNGLRSHGAADFWMLLFPLSGCLLAWGLLSGFFERAAVSQDDHAKALLEGRVFTIRDGKAVECKRTDE